MENGQVILPPEDQVVKFSVATERALILALEQNGITEANFSLSSLRVKMLSFYFLRDMYRIENEQNGKISATKFAGYWAFWIRKIKPIGSAFDPTNENFGTKTHLAEKTTINEVVAVDVGLNFLAHEGKGQPDGHVHDFIRYDCKTECNGSDCMLSYAQKFFEFRKNINQKYLLSSMSHRTFGPHHTTMLFEQLVFGGCRG